MSLEHMLWVFKHSKAEHGARLVMLALADHANEEDVSYPSVATIGVKALLSDRQVQRNLRLLVEELEELEELPEKSPYGTTQYRLCMGGDKMSGGDILSPGGVTFATGNVSEMSPEPTPKPKPENPQSARDAQGALLPDPVEEVWAHYAVTLDRPRAQLSRKVRKWIADAIKTCGVEKTKQAISGLAASQFHREKGFLGIEYALVPKQGQTIESRIEMMAAKAGPATSGKTTVAQLLATVPSEAHDIVRSRMEKVIAATRSDREATKHAAETALRQLREHPPYIEPEYADGKVTGWRRVRNG